MSKREIVRRLSESPRAQQQRQEIQSVTELQDQVVSISQSMADLTDQTRRTLGAAVKRQNEAAAKMDRSAKLTAEAARRSRLASQEAIKASKAARKAQVQQGRQMWKVVAVTAAVATLASSLVTFGLLLIVM